MEPADGTELWNLLLAEGGDSLEPAQRLRLAALADDLAPLDEAQASALLPLASALIADGEAEAALAILDRAVTVFELLAEPRSPDRMDALRSLATALLRADRVDEAEAAVDRLAELAAVWTVGRHGWDAMILYHRAAIADRRGTRAEAPEMLRRALDLAEIEWGPVGGWSDIIRRALADALSFLGRDGEMADLCRRAIQLSEGNPEGERLWLLQLADYLGRHGPSPELDAVQARLVALSAEAGMAGDQAEDLLGQGRIQVEAGRPSEAVPILARAIALAEQGDGAETGLLPSARFWLAQALIALDDADPAQIHELFRAAVEGFSAVAGDGDDATLFARRCLGRFLWDMGLLEEAEAELASACVAARAADSTLAGDIADQLARLRRRRLAMREKGRIFAWALAKGRVIHAEDRLSLALAVLRAAAENAEAEADRHMLWAETAILLAAAGHDDQASVILAEALADPGASAQRARVQAQLAAECLKSEQAEAGRAIILQAGTQALEAGDDAMADLIDALARACGREALELAETLVPDQLRPRLRQAMVAERLAADDLEQALVLLDDWRGPALDACVIRDAAALALQDGRNKAAIALARTLSGTPLDRDGVRLLLEAGAETEATAAVGDLESGLPFIEGVALMARHFALRGERATFIRRAGEAFTQLASYPLPPEDAAVPLRRIAEGALDLMGKDQALVWAAGLLPDALVSDFARAMGVALEEKRGIGGDASAIQQGVALEQSRSLAALGRWDDALAALAPVEEGEALVAAGIRVAEAAVAAGDGAAAARALKHAFTRLGGVDARCGRRLGEAVAVLLPAEWRGAFSDAALSRAAGMEAAAEAATFVVAAAHAAMGAAPDAEPGAG